MNCCIIRITAALRAKRDSVIMKVIIYIFAATCLINDFIAADLSAFDRDVDLENYGSNFLNFAASDDDGVKEIVYPHRRSTTTQKTPTPTPTTPSPRPTITSSASEYPTTPSSIPTITSSSSEYPTTSSSTPTTISSSSEYPTTPSSTPTTISSSSEYPTTPFPTSTTTRRPLPPTSPSPTTTPKPRPPPSPPAPKKNPQIYNNQINSMGPFAGRLINIVLNKEGQQIINQQNHIFYDIKSTGSKFLQEKSNE